MYMYIHTFQSPLDYTIVTATTLMQSATDTKMTDYILSPVTCTEHAIIIIIIIIIIASMHYTCIEYSASHTLHTTAHVHRVSITSSLVVFIVAMSCV